MRRMTLRGRQLQTLRLLLPERALPVYRAALEAETESVAWFAACEGRWLVEAVRDGARDEISLASALALAAAASGIRARVERRPTAAVGWLAQVAASFPEIRIGRRFVIRGSHLARKWQPGRIGLVLDAAMAFGSGEHASTRGCLEALERLAPQAPHRVLDLGTGSGILALAAARLWRRQVLAIDIDPDAVRAARDNARANGLRRLVRVEPGVGWRAPAMRGARPYNLVLANILARPLARMAQSLSRHLAPGGFAVLSGLTIRQEAFVLRAHRRQGLCLTRRITHDGWTTLVLRAPLIRGQNRPAEFSRLNRLAR